MALEYTVGRDGSAPTPRWARATLDLGGLWRRVGVLERRRRFTEQLALLLETGTPLVPALAGMAAQATDGVTATLVGDLVRDLERGSSLADTLATQPDFFPATYVTVVRAAEQGGYLQRALVHLQDGDEQRTELRNLVLGALSYPLFLLVFSGAVVVFVLTAVFPRFGDLFAGLGEALPVTTRVLLGVSALLTSQGWWLAPLALAALVAVVAWLPTPRARLSVYRLLDRVPLVKGIMARLYLVQAMHTLALSLDNGVPLPNALEGCRDLVTSERYQYFIDDLLTSVREGRGLAGACARATWLPPLARQMLATGEEAGELPRVAARIATHHQGELKRHLATLARILEPSLLLLMGAVVGILVSALILPIFSLSHSLH